MAKNKENKKVKKKKSFLESNWILRITIIIVVIPVVIIAFMLLTSVESSGEPVTGSRFKSQLNPEIKSSQIKSIQSSLTYDNVDSVEVNLKSATLRILVDANDGIDQAGIEALANDVYAKVDAVLPISKYFTNQKKTKMYDLEINVYNLIPQEGTTTAQIYAILRKSAAAEEAGLDWVSTPTNEEVSDSLLNPTA